MDPAAPEAQWLCKNPGEVCDDLDNNCEWDYNLQADGSSRESEADEGFTKCPSCPVAEECNGSDDDCDGQIDEELDNCEPCYPASEACNGHDDDCDGLVDEDENGDPLTVPCALAGTPGCQGIRTCTSGDFGTCDVATSAEICDGIDNDCNGQIDDDAEGQPCAPSVPSGHPGIVYGDGTSNLTSICRMGEIPCGSSSCQGAAGPRQEICDGLDNDCDGVVDLAWDGSDLPLVGSPCGACDAGIVACVAGTLECTFSGPVPVEVCNGVDDDCDGAVDEAPLADAPAESGCWTIEPEACEGEDRCSFAELEWCAPEGAGCSDAGVLTSPCAAGTLQCSAGAWTCTQGRLPAGEICDGLDNDCDGATDEGLGSPIGDACGDETGACLPGTIVCDDGVLECSGVGPQAEICDGLDNDCDGEVDNGIALGGECTPTYDASDFPGDRSEGACQPGRLVCDPEGSGELVCQGGVGPQVEVCDGLDNDCDGRVDESGPAPDGIDDTADPADPTRILGATCGSSEGLCLPGTLGCINGMVACQGGVGIQTEECDCVDNDCDGRTDETDPPICSPGKACISVGGECFCAAPCQSGEFPCATGAYSCDAASISGSDVEGRFCIPPSPCGDCSKETVEDARGNVECGPGGTDARGLPIPVCECRLQSCHSPCFGITCEDGLRCVPSGATKGQCQVENCYFFGCETGAMCIDGDCVADPCAENPCEPDETCKPSSARDEARCVPSCADVECDDDERCVEGECLPTGCSEPCDQDEVCLPTGECGQSPCRTEEDALPCSDGAYCEPTTGACVDDPCTGVHCPAGQVCAAGECYRDTTAGAGGAGGTENGGSDAGRSSSGEAGNGPGSGSADEPRGNWGLASGGGGCSCRIRSGPSGSAAAAALALAALALQGRRRRSQRRAAQGGVVL